MIQLYPKMLNQRNAVWLLPVIVILFNAVSFNTTTPESVQKQSGGHRRASSTEATQYLPQTLAGVLPAVFEDAKPDYLIPPIVNGLAPLLTTIPTHQPVVFLGIDDGMYKNATELKLMKDKHIRASLFLDNDAIKDNVGFFQDFTSAGSLIEDHTMTHKNLSRLSYQEQKQEICGQADLETIEYGRRPILFRPPYGDYNTTTQRAAADCGMKAVVLWIAKANGGSMQYQIGQNLKAGDIVLMHFRPEFANDMQAFIDAQNAAGLHTELLEDWLPAQ